MPSSSSPPARNASSPAAAPYGPGPVRLGRRRGRRRRRLLLHRGAARCSGRRRGVREQGEGGDARYVLPQRAQAGVIAVDARSPGGWRSRWRSSGVTLGQLVDAAAEAGLELPRALAVLAGRHGRREAVHRRARELGVGEGRAAVHEYVVGMRVVTPAPASEGYAKVRVVGAGDSELDALKVSRTWSARCYIPVDAWGRELSEVTNAAGRARDGDECDDRDGRRGKQRRLMRIKAACGGDDWRRAG
ncbi:hypothetical protein ACP4OV_021624 [Aristida adscensionis]